MQLRHSKAKDHFGLDTLFIKKCSSFLQVPVTHLVNSSIRANEFPKPWKKAIITSIHSLEHLTWCPIIGQFPSYPCSQKFLRKQLLNNLLITLKATIYCTPNNFGSEQGTQQSGQTVISQNL